VPHRENVFVTRILTDDTGACGALGYDMDADRFVAITARATVLAAGGCTSVYQRSSSRRDENNGDATALAFDAGAELRDMEFVQFHPTGMVAPESLRGRLVTEAVRGEGGRLFNAAGERFMERYAPERLELDARDVVARAIYREIQEGRGTDAGAVFLDISHREPGLIEERLPQIAAQFAEQGIDISREAMEVAPTAHYAMGGIRVDFATGATTLPNLFAVGEATAGVHGANRLGGNSLAETVVFGRLTARTSPGCSARPTAHPPHQRDPQWPRTWTNCSDSPAPTVKRHPREIAADVGAVLWEHAGIIRTADGLREGLEKLADLAHRARRAGADGTRSESFLWMLNLRFMLRTAETILHCALLRDESRGAHFRADAPDSAPRWLQNTFCTLTHDDQLRLFTRPVPGIPAPLQPALEEHFDPQYHHLE
jgi:succinate dehydrogenase / fumarate reductase, flavoprotein subunit